MPPAVKHLGPIILIAATLAAAGWWIFWNYFDTYHLATVRQGILYRDGVRSIRQFQLAIHKTHVKTVVSLVDDNEIQTHPFADEIAYCSANGINLIRIPITLGGWPTSGQIQQFLAIANDPAQQPVMVHCAQGVRRTGMMVAAYQESVLKFDKAQAEAAMMTFGHSQRLVADIKTFIEVYDPQMQSMTQELATSRE
jgi:protein tyrosine/serine phosphatase